MVDDDIGVFVDVVAVAVADTSSIVVTVFGSYSIVSGLCDVVIVVVGFGVIVDVVFGLVVVEAKSLVGVSLVWVGVVVSLAVEVIRAVFAVGVSFSKKFTIVLFDIKFW